MSVHGLLSYLKERNAYKRINLIEKAKKKSLILVVDGDAFIHTLKGRYQIHSNDLAQFYEVAQKWLKVFIENGIGLLFVFDGVVLPPKKSKHERDCRNLWTKANGIWNNPKLLQDFEDPSSIDLYRYLLLQIIHHIQENVIKHFKPKYSSSRKNTGPSNKNTNQPKKNFGSFKKTKPLKKKIQGSIKVKIAQGEADRYIAYLCKKDWKYYGVLSNDTDYIIFGINFLNLSSLCFESKCLCVDVFEPKNVRRVLELPPERLLLLAALIGNDFKSVQDNNKNVFIDLSLKRASEMKRDEIDKLLEDPNFWNVYNFYLLPDIPVKDKDKDAWQLTCDFYQDNGKITEAFKTSLKQYLDLYKKGFFPSDLVHLCCFKEIWLPIVIAKTGQELTNEVSPYEVTEQLRRHIYGFVCSSDSNSKAVTNNQKIQTKQQKATQTKYPSNKYEILTEENESEVDSLNDEKNNKSNNQTVTIREKMKDEDVSLSVELQRFSSQENPIQNLETFWSLLSKSQQSENNNFQLKDLLAQKESETLKFASLLLRYIVEQYSFFQDRLILLEDEFNAFLLHLLILDQRSNNSNTNTNTNISTNFKQDNQNKKQSSSERYTQRGIYLCSLWTLTLIFGFWLNSVCQCPFDPQNLHLVQNLSISFPFSQQHILTLHFVKENLFDPNVFFETLKLFRQTLPESEIPSTLQKHYKELKDTILKGITLPNFSIFLEQTQTDSTKEMDKLTNQFQNLK